MTVDRLYRYDRAQRNWTPISVGEGTLHGLDRLDEQTIGDGESGHIYERTSRRDWKQVPSPTEDKLLAVALGTPDVAVGAGGMIIERQRD